MSPERRQQRHCAFLGSEESARGGWRKHVRPGWPTAPREGTDERFIERGRLDVTAEVTMTKVLDRVNNYG
jgi:hypothetical protein